MPARKKKSGDDSEQIKRALQVCELRYHKEMRQKDIAAKLNVSPATVTRDLEFALERKFVRFKLDPPHHLDLAHRLEEKLATEGIRRVIVAPVPWSNLGHAAARNVGHAAARFFEAKASNGETVVLDGGHTVSSFVDSLAGGDFENLSIIPIAADPPSYEVSAYELMTRMAVKYRGARCQKLPFQTGALLDPSRFAIIEKAKKADFVFLGTGPWAVGNTALDFVSHLGLTPESIRELHPTVACMCGYLGIDHHGRPVTLRADVTSRLQRSLEFEDLVALSAGACHVVLLAATEQKAQAVISDIRARICNTLVLDEKLADALLATWAS
jgi:DNA-binding transcriptional regulator LsrR (DeoR family)